MGRPRKNPLPETPPVAVPNVEAKLADAARTPSEVSNAVAMWENSTDKDSRTLFFFKIMNHPKYVEAIKAIQVAMREERARAARVAAEWADKLFSNA